MHEVVRGVDAVHGGGGLIGVTHVNLAPIHAKACRKAIGSTTESYHVTPASGQVIDESPSDVPRSTDDRNGCADRFHSVLSIAEAVEDQFEAERELFGVVAAQFPVTTSSEPSGQKYL